MENIIKNNFDIVRLNLQNIILRTVENLKQQTKENSSNPENVSNDVKKQIIEHLIFLAPASQDNPSAQNESSTITPEQLFEFISNQSKLTSNSDEELLKNLTPLITKLNTSQNPFFKEVREALSKGMEDLKQLYNAKTISLNSSMQDLLQRVASHELEKDAETTKSMFEFLDLIASNQNKLEDILLNGHALETLEPNSGKVYDPKYLEDLMYKYVELTTSGFNSQFKKDRAEHGAVMGQLTSLDEVMKQLIALYPSAIANLPQLQQQQQQQQQKQPRRPRRRTTSTTPYQELEGQLKTILMMISSSGSNSDINTPTLAPLEKINKLLDQINSILTSDSNNPQFKMNPIIHLGNLQEYLKSL